MPKKGEYVKFNSFERKIKFLFMIYADFKSILLSEDNGKQGLGKFNLKINVILNGLEKYMSFSINNKLSFIESFQLLH